MLGPLSAGQWLLFVGALIVGLLIMFVVMNNRTQSIVAQPHTFSGLPYDPVEPAPDFSLFDTSGQLVQLSDFRGKIVMLFFGYTNCPLACPTTLSIWKQVHQSLGADANDVRFVLISVDPERDTAEKLEQHLTIFNSDFIGLRGDMIDTESIAQAYNVYIEYEDVGSAAGYLIHHTALTYVIDKEGQLVMAFPYETGAPEITADLQYLIRQ